MSKPILNMQGRKFGRWTVICETEKPAGTKEQGVFWLCKCTCGTTQPIPGARLRAGRCQRGCKKCRSHLATAGRKMTPEYQSWRGMRERCLNPNHDSYAYYGGRGIAVSPRWMHSFKNFLEDMGPRPAGHSLDRIDVNGPYAAHNCRWANAHEQRQNSRNCYLTDEQVDAIALLIKAGARQIDIAAAVGVSRGHIANIAVGNFGRSSCE